jgi:hypothetical protein
MWKIATKKQQAGAKGRGRRTPRLGPGMKIATNAKRRTMKNVDAL